MLTDLIEVRHRDLCLSGGADGADLQFGMNAGRAGHEVIHWSYAGHRSQAPAQEVVQLTREQLIAADPYLKHANETLKRKVNFDNPPGWINLLRRNYYQVAWSESVYAVAAIGPTGAVKGGTAWAVQLYLDSGRDEAYVFDQGRTDRWHRWNGAAWDVIDAPPVPRGIYAGVGSRDLLPSGKIAIRALYGSDSAGSHPPPEPELF